MQLVDQNLTTDILLWGFHGAFTFVLPRWYSFRISVVGLSPDSSKSPPKHAHLSSKGCAIREISCAGRRLRDHWTDLLWIKFACVTFRWLCSEGCRCAGASLGKLPFLKGFSWAEKIAAVLLRVAVLRDCWNRSYPRHSLRQMQGRILHGFSYYSQFHSHQIVISYYSI